MDEVGIPEPRARLNAYPHELSGGQQQRVMIAMAIACEPKLLIADEPTTALDVTVQRQIVDLLARLQERQKMSMLFISHDLGLVGEVADSVVVMRHGEVREAGPVAAIFGAPRDAYTQALLACRPRLDTRPRRLPVIDDIVHNRPLATEQREAVAAGPALIEVHGPCQGLPAEGRPVPPQGHRCGEARRLHAAQGPHAGRGRRIRFGQDHHRDDAHAPDRRQRRDASCSKASTWHGCAHRSCSRTAGASRSFSRTPTPA